MTLETKEKTALNASVGADAGQSIQSKTTEIITAESPEINDLGDISQEKIFPADAAYGRPGLFAHGFHERAVRDSVPEQTAGH